MQCEGNIGEIIAARCQEDKQQLERSRGAIKEPVTKTFMLWKSFSRKCRLKRSLFCLKHEVHDVVEIATESIEKSLLTFKKSVHIKPQVP